MGAEAAEAQCSLNYLKGEHFTNGKRSMNDLSLFFVCSPSQPAYTDKVSHYYVFVSFLAFHFSALSDFLYDLDDYFLCLCCAFIE